MNLVDLCAPRDQALKRVGQPRLRVDAVEPSGVRERGEDRPVFGSALAAGEQSVVPAHADRAHGPLHRVVVDFQPAVVEEQRQSRPALQRVPDRRGQRRRPREFGEPLFEPGLVRLHQRPGFGLAHGAPRLGAHPADALLDGVKFHNPPQGFASDRRLRRLVTVEQLPSRVGVAEDENDRRSQPLGEMLVSRVAVNLEHACKALEHFVGPLAFPVAGEGIGHRGEGRALARDGRQRRSPTTGPLVVLPGARTRRCVSSQKVLPCARI